jgi:hypothetical protein
MITIWEGNLDDVTQLENEIALTGQEQAALANAIINGVAVLRVHCGTAYGSPAATLVSIECSWYDFFRGDTGVAPIWRACESLSLGAGSDADLGSNIECQGPQITAPALACYPTMIRLNWSNVVLGPAAWVENFKLGIMLSSSLR